MHALESDSGSDVQRMLCRLLVILITHSFIYQPPVIIIQLCLHVYFLSLPSKHCRVSTGKSRIICRMSGVKTKGSQAYEAENGDV